MTAQLEKKLAGLDLKVRELHRKWRFFIQAFGHKERVDLLNSTAGAFFRCAQDAMLNDILLAISRLLDPAKSAGQETLSFKNVLNDISDQGIRAELDKCISALKQTTAQMKEWRDKAIAHNDLTYALSTGSISDIQMSDIVNAIRLVGETVNLLFKHFKQTTVLYSFAADPLGDGDALLVRLKLGAESFLESHEKAREAREWLWKCKPIALTSDGQKLPWQ